MHVNGKTLSRRRLLANGAGALAGLTLTTSCASLSGRGKTSRQPPGFKLGVCDWTVGKTSHPESFDVAQQIGLDGVQVDFGRSETCDVAGYVWSQTALLAVTGEGRMADRAERAFFNAGAATVSRDFKTHVYFQSPNRFAARSPDFPHRPRASGGSYQPKHAPLCCTAALNRILPYYVTHMWMAT